MRFFFSILFLSFNFCFSQIIDYTDLEELRDSVRKFKEIKPSKALEYSFEIINKSNDVPSPLLVGIYAAVGDILNNKI